MISIRYKAVLPVGVLAIILAATSWLADIALTKLYDTTHSLVGRFHEIEEVRQMEAEANKLVYALFGVATTASDEAKGTATEIFSTLNERIADLRQMQVVNDEERELLQDVSADLEEIHQSAQPLFADNGGSDPANNTALIADLSKQLAALTKRLNSWHSSETKQVDELGRQAENLPQQFAHVAAMLGGAALLVLLLALWANNRMLVKPILTISKSTEELASGRLEHELAMTTNDEIGRLAGNINRMAESLSEVHRRLAQLANTDALTGLMNRRGLENIAGAEIALAIRHNRNLCIAIFDVDHFKAINDRFGHSVGDAVLQFIALIVAGTIRRSDYVFRLGGEEFVILLRDTTNSGALVTLERCRQAIAAQPCETNGRSVAVTASFGYAVLHAHGTELAILLENADAALYQAKNAGRNRCVEYVPMETSTGA